MNYAALLKWAIHNNNEAKARRIANAIIQGTELLSSDVW